MDELLAEFTREAEAVGAEVSVACKATLAETLSYLLGDAKSVVIAPGLEKHVEAPRGSSREIIMADTRGEATDRLSTAGVGVCEALAGVSASGTVLVGPGSGLEGHISTLPPHSIVVLDRDRLHADVASALDAVSNLVAASGSRLAFITGPSRTSDIELTPVVGVHGPLRLDLVVVDG